MQTSNSCLSYDSNFFTRFISIADSFQILRERKIRQYRDDSPVDEEKVQEVEPIVEPAAESMTEAIGEHISETSVPKKRGRKSKPKNVTDEPVSVGPGRPTLTRNGLETDVVQPVLRRSERSKNNKLITKRFLNIFLFDIVKCVYI